ncbi:hypothetical protein [Adhaeretor mobilis]|uniref:Uncharacterized protein n=1 Tax=Adhaeretor mobilis TaxID=1930276 RepID=A0A517MUH0_9BACT|nr:hypothetical protein [Adhaeretor mobilis]QDS98535.1 hypothetical protein HG15A2_18160 [Adhaeretor mobilis]
MPINVICPKCHTRFKVGDQHAGKTGACPKCKGPIEIPAAGDEVIIHAPELEAGAKDSKGRSVLKPIARTETKLGMNMLVVIIGTVVMTLAIALLARFSDLGEMTIYVLTAGAILLGPPIAYAGYSFLKDDELGSYEGSALYIRCLSCGLVYALLWGVFIFVGGQIFDEDSWQTGLEMVPLVGLTVPIMLMGTFAAFVCFDLEPFSAFFHYALYIVATALLRLIMGLTLLPGMDWPSGILGS